MNKILCRLFGKRFRVKLHLPLGAYLYYRLYYSNSYGIFWTRIFNDSGNGHWENVMLPVNDKQEAIKFAEQFKSVEDVRNFEAKEREKMNIPQKTIHIQ